MASFRKIGRNWFYRYVDASGVQRERKGCTDRRVTEQMAVAAEAEVAKIKAGLIDPKTIAYSAHESRSLVEHLGDWHAHMLAKGSTAKHATHCRNRAGKLVSVAKAKWLSDLTPSRIQAALKA